MAYSPKHVIKLTWLLRSVLVVGTAITALTGCDGHRHIVVGGKDFAEQSVLVEILAQHIEKKTGLPVERQCNLTGTYIADQELRAGKIDLYPEYTGTALIAILKEKSWGTP